MKPNQAKTRLNPLITRGGTPQALSLPLAHGPYLHTTHFIGGHTGLPLYSPQIHPLAAQRLDQI